MIHAQIVFDAPLAAFAKAAGIEFKAAFRKVAGDLLTNIVKRTPVDTGRARAGWQLTVGAPSEYLPPELPEGMPQLPVYTGGVEKIDGTEVAYIVNNLPYIEPLENGHSSQAPAGMVRIAMAEEAAKIEIMLEKML